MTFPTLLASTSLAALCGSLHCIAMCGGMVGIYSGMCGRDAVDTAQSPRRHATHAAYNLGRLVIYVLLGTLFGALGTVVDLAGSLAGVQRVSALIAGALVIGFALQPFVRRTTQRRRAVAKPRLSILLGSLLKWARPLSPVARAGLVGLSSGLLPCGWLYAFVIAAAGAGGGLNGAALLAAFWLGTVPALLGVGYGLGTMFGAMRRKAPAITAVALIALGALTICDRSLWIGVALVDENSVTHAAVTTTPAQIEMKCCGD
ncbi:MAG: sulfite exporter TauE/SafE family protein [Planctomycetota bacterium]